MCHLKKSASTVLVATKKSYALYDYKQQTIVHSFIKSSSNKKGSEDQTPNLIEISNDDSLAYEAYNSKVVVRSLKSKQVLASYEGHQHKV